MPEKTVHRSVQKSAGVPEPGQIQTIHGVAGGASARLDRELKNCDCDGS